LVRFILVLPVQDKSKDFLMRNAMIEKKSQNPWVMNDSWTLFLLVLPGYDLAKGLNPVNGMETLYFLVVERQNPLRWPGSD